MEPYLLADIAFPLGIRLTHAFNIVFLSLLIRSGIEIIGGHPMLYFNDHCTPGTEWIRFTDKRMYRDRRWTAEDEKQHYTPWVALPGRDHLGLGRFWHFVAVVGWLLTGLAYLVVLVVGDQWERLIPTSWDVFGQALDAGVSYLSLDVPSAGEGYNALQQLTYFGLIFVITPLQILTGIAMSPALEGRFPWFPKLFGGRQAARSLHFIGLVVFIAFTVHHVALVIAHGLLDGLAEIVLGSTDPTTAEHAVAASISLLFFAALIALHVWATRVSLLRPHAVLDGLLRIWDPIQSRLLQPLASRQRYRESDITATPRPNGRPPRHPEYIDLLSRGFEGWRFEVGGLVERPRSFTLEELRALAPATHITTHKCIQGWSYVASWEGVPLSVLLEACGPLTDARYLLFRTFDDKWEVPGAHGEFYAVLDLDQARQPQTILAYGMNGQPLSSAFGAPLRLRMENQLGYNMAKFVRSLELVSRYDDIGAGYGGWRADELHYSRIAPI